VTAEDSDDTLPAVYPPLASGEATVDALCHRDDMIAGEAVLVAFCDDRMEVTSLGLMPSGLTVANLKRDHAPASATR
jgi:predicted HTH transcriptional regulator